MIINHHVISDFKPIVLLNLMADLFASIFETQILSNFSMKVNMCFRRENNQLLCFYKNLSSFGSRRVAISFDSCQNKTLSFQKQ